MSMRRRGRNVLGQRRRTTTLSECARPRAQQALGTRMRWISLGPADVPTLLRPRTRGRAPDRMAMSKLQVHPNGMAIIQGCEERATRATLGKRVTSPLNPERVESIPHVTFIEFHSISSKQPAELILKRNLPVVLLLSRDVVLRRFNLRKANREDPVAILPGETFQIRPFGPRITLSPSPRWTAGISMAPFGSIG